MIDVEIEVTDKHINKSLKMILLGDKHSPFCCPIALSVCEKLQKPVSVGLTVVRVLDHADSSERYVLENSLVSFRAGFDKYVGSCLEQARKGQELSLDYILTNCKVKPIKGVMNKCLQGTILNDSL